MSATKEKFTPRQSCYTVKEAMAYLRVSESTIHRLIAR